MNPKSIVNLSYLCLGAVFIYSVFNSVYFQQLADREYLVSACLLFILILSAGFMTRLRLWPLALTLNFKNFGPTHVFVTALMLRLTWILAADAPPNTDYAYYDTAARGILEHFQLIFPYYQYKYHIYSGVSLFSAAHYFLFGYHPLLPQISTAFLSSLQVVLIYRMILASGLSRDLALLSGMILAFWPEHILVTSLLGADALFSILVTLAFWVLIRDGRRLRFRSLLWSGFCLGAAHWFRPTAPIFVAAIIVFLTVRRIPKISRRFLNAAVVLLPCLLLVAPIFYMNYKTFGIISPHVVQSTGWTFLVGTNPASKGGYSSGDDTVLNLAVAVISSRYPREEVPPFFLKFVDDIAMRIDHLDELKNNTTVLRDKIALAMTRNRITQLPWETILSLIVVHKIRNLWATPIDMPFSARNWLNDLKKQVNGLSDAYHKFMLFFAGLFLIKQIGRREREMEFLTVMVFLALVVTGFHFFAESQCRYHHMFLPLLAICAGGYFLEPFRAREAEKPR